MSKKKKPAEASVGGRFPFEPSREFTGRMQYATDRAASISTPKGSVRRGEVFEVKSEKYALGLIANGNFAHAPENAPLGVEGDLEPKVAAAANTEPSTDSKE